MTRGATKSHFETTHMLEGGECGIVRTLCTGPHCVRRTSPARPLLPTQDPVAFLLQGLSTPWAPLQPSATPLLRINLPFEKCSLIIHRGQNVSRQLLQLRHTGCTPPPAAGKVRVPGQNSQACLHQRDMLLILKLHMSQSQHLQRQRQRNG